MTEGFGQTAPVGIRYRGYRYYSVNMLTDDGAMYYCNRYTAGYKLHGRYDLFGYR